MSIRKVFCTFETIQSTPNIEGIIITKDNRFAATSGLKQDFQLLYS